MPTLSASDGRLDPPAPAPTPEPTIQTADGSLSLDHKLAAIAQDRAVLHLLRDLADRGLREGDPVRHRTTGMLGRLVIERAAVSPRILVWPDRSGDLPLPAGDLASWQRR
jgi:hypothetical protein